MSFINLYDPSKAKQVAAASSTEEDETSIYGPTPYDINFAFPLPTEALESHRVRLTPFVPRVHGEAYWDAVQPASKELFRYFGTEFTSLEESLAYYEKRYRQNPEFVYFDILDKSRSPEGAGKSGVPEEEATERLAGVIGLRDISSTQLTTEIASVIIFPAFQRTHVATHAVGVLLRYCLDLPSASPPGLGLRRVQWISFPQNTASLRLAEKMGFKKEGVNRWLWASGGEEGNKPRRGDPEEDKGGWDSVTMAVCWDDWEEGVRDAVQTRMST